MVWLRRRNLSMCITCIEMHHCQIKRIEKDLDSETGVYCEKITNEEQVSGPRVLGLLSPLSCILICQEGLIISSLVL